MASTLGFWAPRYSPSRKSDAEMATNCWFALNASTAFIDISKAT